HRGADSVKDERLHFGKRAFDEGAGCGFVPAAAPNFGDLAAIDAGATAEADFEAAALLLDENHGDLCPTDRQSQIDRVLGIAGQSIDECEVLFENMGVGEVAI